MLAARDEVGRGDVEVVGVESVASEEPERYVVINCVVDRLGGGGRRGGEGPSWTDLMVAEGAAER